MGCPNRSKDTTQSKKLTRSDSTLANPTTSAVNCGSSPLEIDSGRSISVSLPQNSKKPEPIEKYPNSSQKNPDPDEKTQILARYQVDSVRFWLNLVKWFLSDLLKSHRIQRDFHQIWWNLTVFSSFLAVYSELWLRLTRLLPIKGLICQIWLVYQ